MNNNLWKYFFKMLFAIIVSSLIFISCEGESVTESLESPFVGTWNYSNYEFKQDIITNSDQITTPLMGIMIGIAPFDGGLIIEHDGITDTLNYMLMFYITMM